MEYDGHIISTSDAISAIAQDHLRGVYSKEAALLLLRLVLPDALTSEES